MENTSTNNTDIIASTHLGKKISGSEIYDPSLLVAIPRIENRKQYNLQNENLPFEGFDVWHAYEFSAMTENGIPVTRLLKIKYDCRSEFLVESKSLKLYLNSFNMTKFGSTTTECLEICADKIKKDLSEKLKTQVSIKFLENSIERAEIFSNFKNIMQYIDEKNLKAKNFKEAPELLQTEDLSNLQTHYLTFDSLRSNCRYGKNQKREDVKSHHYIISFDPRDAVDNGLTVDRAQALGEEFCRKQFPGHQAIVCTHPDGHNHSGNIHVHIVINSLRIEEVPFLPYMDRPADTRAGCKHRCTDAAMEYFKAEVMELCHRENLYQIDLLHGSKNRITEREYWAQRKGQAKLDKEAAALPAEEQPAKPTKFETDKEKLRQAIRTALSSATSYGEFAAVLLQQGVTVKESRGRLSYLTPDRTKPITARKLGDDFDRAAVLALLEQNAHRAAEQTATVPEYPRNIRERLQGKKAVQTTPEKDGIQRMVDRAAKRAEGKGAGYDRWAAVHNLKQMAATVAAYGQYGYSPEELDAALVSANADLQDSTAKLKALDAAIREKKELQTQVLAYAKTKPARDGLKAQKTEKARSAYRERHESDFIIADAATRYFRAHGVSKLPSHKALQAEIEQLTAEKNAHYNEYREKKARVKELHTVKSNLSQILQGEKDREKKHEHER